MATSKTLPPPEVMKWWIFSLTTPPHQAHGALKRSTGACAVLPRLCVRSPPILLHQAASSFLQAEALPASSGLKLVFKHSGALQPCSRRLGGAVAAFAAVGCYSHVLVECSAPAPAVHVRTCLPCQEEAQEGCYSSEGNFQADS